MKFVDLHYRSGDDERRVLLEGDRRQTVDRMVRVGLATLFDARPEPTDEEDTYRIGDGDQRVTVESATLVDPPEAESLRTERYTVIVNENVTENACRVSYSH